MPDKIFRSQWRGFFQRFPEKEKIEACRYMLEQAKRDGKILTGEIYCWQSNLFAYLEGIDEHANPEVVLAPLADYLSIWPGDKLCRWAPMMDVFHFNEPKDFEHWRRKVSPEKCVGKIGILRPEMVASYIYYHYGLQEERTFCGDKYEIIALHENILFGYFEIPEVIEAPLYEPRLKTKSMPENWKDAQIPSHFFPWENYKGSLLPMPSLFSQI